MIKPKTTVEYYGLKLEWMVDGRPQYAQYSIPEIEWILAHSEELKEAKKQIAELMIARQTEWLADREKEIEDMRRSIRELKGH